MNRTEIILLVAAVAVVAFFVGRGTVPRPIEGVVEVHDTTTVVRVVRDTVRDIRTRTVVRVDTVRLAAAPDSTGARRDSVRAEVPIERVHVEGEYYSAVLEGFRPSIVEMNLRIPETTITNDRTVTVRKRWSFVAGPQIGIGYTPEGVRPYIGAGVSFGYCF